MLDRMEVATKLRKGDYDGAKETAIRYRNIFGEENYFLEMQDQGLGYWIPAPCVLGCTPQLSHL